MVLTFGSSKLAEQMILPSTESVLLCLIPHKERLE